MDKAEHQQLIEQVQALRSRFSAGSAGAGELMDLLKTWLTDHILKTDKALARELLARGAKSRHADRTRTARVS